jgi:uncharacterized paraquat-inducible protein A
MCSPAVVNGVVYIGSNDNNVYAIGALTSLRLPTTYIIVVIILIIVIAAAVLTFRRRNKID